MNRKQKRSVKKKIGKENYDKLLTLIQYETLESLKKINEKIVELRVNKKMNQEDFAEIAAVNATDGGNVFDGNMILKILLNIVDCFFDIVIAHLTAGNQLGGLGGLGKVIQKQIQVSDQMQG